MCYLRRAEPGTNVVHEANLALRPFRLAPRPFPTDFRRSDQPLKYYLPNSSHRRRAGNSSCSGRHPIVCEWSQNVSSTKATFAETTFQQQNKQTTQHNTVNTIIALLEALRYDRCLSLLCYEVLKAHALKITDSEQLIRCQKIHSHCIN